jgi:hypothetical protein
MKTNLSGQKLISAIDFYSKTQKLSPLEVRGNWE